MCCSYLISNEYRAEASNPQQERSGTGYVESICRLARIDNIATAVWTIGHNEASLRQIEEPATCFREVDVRSDPAAIAALNT